MSSITSQFRSSASSDEQDLFGLLTRTLQQAQALVPTAGFATFVFAAVIYPVAAFSIAVVLARVSPRGWTGRTFRKYLWLIPFSPLIIVIGFVGFLLTIVGLGLRIIGNGFSALFEKVTGQPTYRREREYSAYRYRGSHKKGGDAPPK